jgi:hypothetical protein
MRVANDVFETWYSSNFDEKEDEKDIKALFKEAFEAGMVSGFYFMETHLAGYVNAYVEDITKDYRGFQYEN